MGDNTKAAIIRLGLMELRKFCKLFYSGVKDDTFFESCGVLNIPRISSGTYLIFVVLGG
jgi:glycerol-3-phosphate dehydrogenase (NAD+)